MVPPGFKVDPNEVELIELYCIAASGQRIDFIREVDVYSNHPCVLFGSSIHTNDSKKIHMAWSAIRNDSDVRKIGVSDEYFWVQSGDTVIIHEATTDPAIGCYKKFVLVEFGVKSSWIMREYKALAKEYQQCQSALYEVCFESKAYLKARDQMKKAHSALEKAFRSRTGCASFSAPLKSKKEKSVRSNKDMLQTALLKSFIAGKDDKSSSHLDDVCKEMF
ncbi:NAC domain-containing protein 37 [Tanacetum coccineum]